MRFRSATRYQDGFSFQAGLVIGSSTHLSADGFLLCGHQRRVLCGTVVGRSHRRNPLPTSRETRPHRVQAPERSDGALRDGGAGRPFHLRQEPLLRYKRVPSH